MLLIRKKVTQVGREGRCITLPKVYLNSLMEKGFEIKEMMMQIHDDDSITLLPIKEKIKK